MRRSYVIFAVVSSALMMIALDGTIFTVALPAMLSDMHTTLPLVTWTLTAYQLTNTIVLPLSGRLSERWGRKTIFLAAIILFSLSSIGCGLAPNIYVLIAFRGLQAAGGGMFFPSAAGMVGDVFEGGARQTAIGLFVTIFQIGGVIGPNIGGVIVDHLSWRWIFFVNIPIGILILVLGTMLLPKNQPRQGPDDRSFDTTGVGLFAGGMFALLFGLTHMANHPDQLVSPSAIVFVGGGVVMLALFVAQELRCETPIIDVRLFRWRPFWAANAQQFIWSGTFNAFFAFIPYYVTIAYGMNATQSGAILTPRSLVAVFVSAASSFFIVRLGYRLPWLVGTNLLGLSMLLMSFAFHDVSILGFAVSNFVWLSAITCIAGLGVGIAIPPAQNANFDLLPDQMTAVAGLRAMFGNSGAVIGATGVALALSQFQNKVSGLEDIFFAMAVLMLVSQALILLVPDRVKDGHAQVREHEVAAAPVE